MVKQIKYSFKLFTRPSFKLFTRPSFKLFTRPSFKHFTRPASRTTYQSDRTSGMYTDMFILDNKFTSRKAIHKRRKR